MAYHTKFKKVVVYAAVLLIAGSAFSGCRKSTAPPARADASSSPDDSITWVQVVYRSHPLTAWKQNGKYYIGDDIQLYEAEIEQEQPLDPAAALSGTLRAKGTAYPSTLTKVPINVWPGNQIPYVIDASIAAGSPLYQRLQSALDYWNGTAPIQLVPVTNPAASNILLRFVRASSRCRCTIGYSSARNGECSLSDECDLRSIVHEIGHGTGLLHEHTRGIRDNALELNADAMNFIRNTYLGGRLWSLIVNNVVDREDAQIGGVDIDQSPFDFNSLMLYGSYPQNNAALRDALINHVPPLPLYRDKLGNLVPRPAAAALSTKDLAIVRKMYPRKLVVHCLDYGGLNAVIKNNTLTVVGNVPIPSGSSLELTYDPVFRFWSWSGHQIRQIQFSNPNFENLLYLVDEPSSLVSPGNREGKIYYVMAGQFTPLFTESMVPSRIRIAETIDQDGINGNGAASISTYADAATMHVVISPWADYSTDLTNSIRHVFNPATLRQIRFINNTTATIPFKVRLKGVRDVFERLAPGATSGFQFEWRSGSNNIYLNGALVQQIGLDDQSSTDAINVDWSNTNNTVTYVPGGSNNGNSGQKFFISRSGYYHGLVDMNGLGSFLRDPIKISPELVNGGATLNIRIAPL